MSEDRAQGEDGPRSTPAVARAQVGRASVAGSTAGDLAGLGVLPSRQPAEGRTYRAGDYSAPTETPAEPAPLKPAEGSITPAPVLTFTRPPNPGDAPVSGDMPASAGLPARTGFADFSGGESGAAATGLGATGLGATAGSRATTTSGVAAGADAGSGAAAPSGTTTSSGAAAGLSFGARVSAAEPSGAAAAAGGTEGGASAWSNFAMPKRETADASLNAAVAAAQSEPAAIQTADKRDDAPAETPAAAGTRPDVTTSPDPRTTFAPATASAATASVGTAYGALSIGPTSPASPAAAPLGVQPAAWPSALAFGDDEGTPASTPSVTSTPSATVPAAPDPTPLAATPAFGSTPVSAPPVTSAPQSSGGRPVMPPVPSGPPAFRAASPTSYGLSASAPARPDHSAHDAAQPGNTLPAATSAPVQRDYSLPAATAAPVQPEYSLPAQRSGTAVPGEPTRARASVPGLNRMTPGSGGVVGSATSGSGHPRVYRAGAPDATGPDPVEPPDPMEPPQPPEPPEPAEPPAPGPGPVPTPFPDPHRPGPAPSPQPGPPVPMPPAPPVPQPGPPFPSPSPMPPFPPPPATGGTTWSSAAATGRGAEADVSSSPWPASEMRTGRQWPPRGDAPVTPVVRGLSADGAQDPHGVAASAEYNQWARGQRREPGTVYSPPARAGEPRTRGVPSNPAIENTGSLTGHILSPQRWKENSESGNSTRVVVILGGVISAIVIIGIIAAIMVGDQLRGLFGQ